MTAAVLTEGPAIVQYLADLKPDSGLAPRAGTFERYQLMEILNYITSELHKSFRPLFNPADLGRLASEAPSPTWTRNSIGCRISWRTRPFLLGNTFTVADAYLFTVLGWTGHVKIDLVEMAGARGLPRAHRAAPQGQQALKDEGLMK